MKLTNTLAAAACAVMVAGSAVAGGFEATVTENDVTVIPVTPPAATGSLPGWVIPAVIVAGLVAVATASDDS